VKLLVAGIGNIFFGDDGFGPEVARELAREPIDGVTIEDYGIRGLHLAYDLVSGYDGTLYVIEPELPATDAAPDPHRMDLENVFAFIRTIGGQPPPITIVGCEPSGTGEEIGLTEPVRRAIGPAAGIVRRLVTESLAEGISASEGVQHG
jgi:hydrogenase maturation protease